METANKQGKEAPRAAELRPAGAEFFGALMKLLRQRIPVRIVFVGDQNGNVVFEAKYSDLGLPPEILSDKFCQSHCFANFLGLILVRNNLPLFCERILERKTYATLVRKFAHRDFGMRTQGDGLSFIFHMSLVYQLLNEAIAQEISREVAEIPVIVPAKRVKRGAVGEKITVLADDQSTFRIVVPKADELRLTIESAIETVLDHFAVKNKDVLVNDNQFNLQIDITEKTTQK